MSWIAAAVVGGSVVSGVMSSKAQSKAANTAADAQTQAAQMQVDETSRQFDKVQELLKPYVDQGKGALGRLAPYEQAGVDSLSQIRNLNGMNGVDAQRAAIESLSNSPEMQAYIQQGEEGILQNASATGNLRGGNTQAMLQQFRPQLLAQMINNQFTRLGGLTSLGSQTTGNIAQLGQASAAGVGSAAQTAGQNISQAYGQMGAANAGAALAAGQGQANAWQGIGNTASMLGTLKLMGKF